jgi:cytochrome b561
MTGFGDLQPNANVWLSYLVVGFHVMIGYFLLAALVTRLAILFTASGPASSDATQNMRSKERTK